jgi:hypothetical protein
VSADAISVFGRTEHERIRRILLRHEGTHPEAVAKALALREARVRRGELQGAFRAGELPMRAWLHAREVPLRRRLRLAALALLRGRRD